MENKKLFLLCIPLKKRVKKNVQFQGSSENSSERHQII